MIKKTLFLFCIYSNLTGCFDKNEFGQYPIIEVIGNAGNYKKVYCSDLFSSIELIQLETKAECLLDAVEFPEIILNDSLILIPEKHGFNLYAFDRTGKFRNEIGKRGQGPGEYLSISNFFLNSEKATIFVESISEILEYDYSGKFIHSFNKISTNDGSQLNKYFYVGNSLFIGSINYTGTNKYKYCLFNQQDIVKYFPNHIFFNRERDFSMKDDGAFPPIKVDNRLYLKDYINDTIYILEKSELQPVYVFGLGKYSYPKKYLENSPIGEAYYFPLQRIVGMPKLFFYTIGLSNFSTPKTKPKYDSYFNEFRPDDFWVFGIYDIEKNKNTLLDTDQYLQKGIINDYNGGLPFIPLYYAGNNLVVGVWNVLEMKEMLTEEYFASKIIKNPQAHQKLKALLKNMKEDDNPIVVVAKLK